MMLGALFRPASSDGRPFLLLVDSFMPPCRFTWRTLFLAMIASITCLPRASAIEHVLFRRNGSERELAGQVLATVEGGLLLETPSGYFWPISFNEVVRRQADDTPFVRLGKDEHAQSLLGDLPAGFEVFRTRHYLIAHATTQAYARWCGSLFERLYAAYTNFWQRRGLKLREPDYPLVVLLFAEESAFREYARGEGVEGGSIVAYYSIQSNRVAMYDLTGIERDGGLSGRGRRSTQVERVLASPNASRAVATVVHEATHQIAFNCGMHSRYSDVPLWVSEGIAVYFESPDLQSPQGWRGVGRVNVERLTQFREYQARRPIDSLRSLLASDERFRAPETASEAYAEAWAVNYYLLKKRSDEYIKYLRELAGKPYLVVGTPEGRIAEFTAVFGGLDAFDQQFLRYLEGSK